MSNPARRTHGGRRRRSRGRDEGGVSVVTVVYNGERHLRQTIESVIGQTHDAMEYVIIDGGSTDGTLDIIREHDEEIDYWISEPDDGIGDAFNKGIRECTGDWIGIINADDWYEADAAAKVASSPPCDIAYGDMRVWLNSDATKVHHADHLRLHRSMSIGHPSVFIRRDAYLRWGLYDPSMRLAMDFELLLRMQLRGASFHKCEAVLANFRAEGASDSREYEAIGEVRRVKSQQGVNSWLLNEIDYGVAMAKCFLARSVAGLRTATRTN